MNRTDKLVSLPKGTVVTDKDDATWQKQDHGFRSARGSRVLSAAELAKHSDNILVVAVPGGGASEATVI